LVHIHIFLPIHYCSHRNNIEAFQICFLEGMKHYPNKLGFVFHKSHNNDFADTSRRIQARRVGIDKTPFEMECDQYGKKKVSKIIYDRLTKSVDKAGDGTITTDIESLFLALAIGDSEAASKIDFNAVDLFLGNYPDAKRQLKEFSSNPEKFAAINARASTSAAATTTANCLAIVSTTTATTTNVSVDEPQLSLTNNDDIDNGLEGLKISGTKVAAATEEEGDDDSDSSGNNNNNNGEGKHDDGNTTDFVTNDNVRKVGAATIEPSAAATAEKEIATAKKVTNYIHDYLFSDHITMACNNCGIDGEEEKE